MTLGAKRAGGHRHVGKHGRRRANRNVPPFLEKARPGDMAACYAALLTQIPAITYVAALDPASTTLYISPRVKVVLGFSPADFQTDPDLWRRQLHAADRGRVLRELRTARRRRQAFRSDYRMVARNGRVVWFRDEATVIRGTTGRPLFLQGTMLDVTRQKELAHRMMETVAREQTRIGQDLHDYLGQELCGLALLAEELRRNLAESGAGQSRQAARIAQMARQAADQVRTLARGLCPVGMGREGLRQALQTLADQTLTLFHIRCRVACSGHDTGLDGARATHLYRIVQEAVANAVKHSHATRITIGLSSRKRMMRLSVTDNGDGFRPRRGPHQGMGLCLMASHATVLGGALAVVHPRTGGTQIVCRFANSAAPACENVEESPCDADARGRTGKRGDA